MQAQGEISSFQSKRMRNSIHFRCTTLIIHVNLNPMSNLAVKYKKLKVTLKLEFDPEPKKSNMVLIALQREWIVLFRLK